MPLFIRNITQHCDWTRELNTVNTNARQCTIFKQFHTIPSPEPTTLVSTLVVFPIFSCLTSDCCFSKILYKFFSSAILNTFLYDSHDVLFTLITRFPDVDYKNLKNSHYFFFVHTNTGTYLNYTLRHFILEKFLLTVGSAKFSTIPICSESGSSSLVQCTVENIEF